LPTNNIAFDTISMHERTHLDEDKSKPYCDIRLEFVYPAATSSYNTDTLQRFFVRHMFGTSYDSLTPALAADAYVKNFIENYSADAGIYRETEKDRMKLTELIPGINIYDNELAVKDNFYSYYESLTDSIVFNGYGLISFQVKQSNKKDDAISYNSYRNYVLNLHTGNQVTESDIFNDGYDTALQSLIINSLLNPNK